MLPQQATDGGKDIWCQISTNVPGTQFDTQIFIRNNHEVGKWKLGRKLSSSKPLPVPYCKQPGQPPVGSMNTWFYYNFLVLEDAQKCLWSALKSEVIDIFFKISEQYFQLMYFGRIFFSFLFPKCLFWVLCSAYDFISHTLCNESLNWISQSFQKCTFWSI